MSSAVSLSLLLVSLWGVQSDVVLTQPKAETGTPGGSLTLTCKTSGFTLSSTWMGWIRQVPGQGLEWLVLYYNSASKYYAPGIESRFPASKDTSNNILFLNMRNLKTEDTAIYYCARCPTVYTGYYFDYWGQGTMVTVTTATQSPPTLYALLSSCEQPNTGGPVTYGCLAMDYFPEITSLSWRKDNEPITTGLKIYPSVFNKKGTYTLSSQLTIPESEVGSGTIYCQVQQSGSNLSVPMPAERVSETNHPTLIITLSPSQDIMSSRIVTAVCSIIDFHPESLSVKWLKDGQLAGLDIITSPVFEVNGNFSATSRLRVTSSEWFQGSVYTCRVDHEGAIQSLNISSTQEDAQCNPAVITLPQPSLEQVFLSATVTLTCIVPDTYYGANISWTRGKEILKSEIAVQPGEVPNSVISNLNISTEAWLRGDVFTCVVSHEYLPTPKRESIHREEAKDPREPSVSVLLPPAEEVSAQRFVSLTCLVRGFSPRAVLVKWTVNDKPLNSGTYRNTEVMAENGNSSFFMYSLLSIAAEEWASGASYSCVVGHEANPLKFINRTVNKFSGKPSFVNVSLVLMDTVNSCQ